MQNDYNLAHRDDDAFIDDLAAEGIAYVPFFPLGGFAPLQSSILSDVAAGLGKTLPADGAGRGLLLPLAQHPPDSRHVIDSAPPGKSRGGGIEVAASGAEASGRDLEARRS